MRRKPELLSWSLKKNMQRPQFGNIVVILSFTVTARSFVDRLAGHLITLAQSCIDMVIISQSISSIQRSECCKLKGRAEECDNYCIFVLTCLLTYTLHLHCDIRSSKYARQSQQLSSKLN